MPQSDREDINPFLANGGRPLAGRTAIVTGSGQNIGRAIVLLYASAGANVVVNGHRDGEALERVAGEARALGAEALTCLADVGDSAAVQRMVDQAVERFGAVDIAVSNASRRPHQALLDISVEDWQRVVATNLNACFYMAKAVLPGMKARGWGRLIHISGRDGFTGMTNRAHNVTCKAGMFALSKAIAQEFGPFGITANTVAPGIIDTPRDPRDYPDYARLSEKRRRRVPVRRLGTSADIAQACFYLTTEAGAFVTGQVLHVNGGEFMF